MMRGSGHSRGGQANVRGDVRWLGNTESGRCSTEQTPRAVNIVSCEMRCLLSPLGGEWCLGVVRCMLHGPCLGRRVCVDEGEAGRDEEVLADTRLRPPYGG